MYIQQLFFFTVSEQSKPVVRCNSRLNACQAACECEARQSRAVGDAQPSTPPAVQVPGGRLAADPSARPPLCQHPPHTHPAQKRSSGDREEQTIPLHSKLFLFLLQTANLNTVLGDGLLNAKQYYDKVTLLDYFMTN